MKNKFLFLVTLAIAQCNGFAQTIYSNDFEGDDPLSDMITYDEDGLFPVFGEYGTTWTVTHNYVTDDEMLVSNSYVMADENVYDWVITPAIEVPSAGYHAIWENWAASFGPDFALDQYQVLVSTTGTEIADFSLVFSESSAPLERTVKSISLDAYAGETIHIAWRNISYSFLMNLDNIEVRFVEELNIKAPEFHKKNVFTMGDSFTPEFDFENLGSATINSIDISFTFDGETISETITGLDVIPFATGTVTLPTQTVSMAQQYPISYTFSNPNGETDPDPSDNSQSSSYYSIENNAETRTVIGEIAQGTSWCETCPEGYVFLNELSEELPEDFIGIAVHAGDTLALFDYLVAIPDFLSYPRAHLNRTTENIEIADINAAVESARNTPNPFTISALFEYNETANTIGVELSATSTIGFDSDDFRFAMLILEDSLKGETADWNQANTFAGGGLGEMGGFELLPNPAPADLMVYNHVIRDYIGAEVGIEGSISSVTAGSPFYHELTYSVPDHINLENTRAVVVIMNAVTGEIMNATQFNRDDFALSIHELEEATLNTVIYPNPNNGQFKFELTLVENQDVNIEIIDFSGKTIQHIQKQLPAGTTTLEMATPELPNGTYFLSVTADKQSFTKKFSIIH